MARRARRRRKTFATSSESSMDARRLVTGGLSSAASAKEPVGTYSLGAGDRLTLRVSAAAPIGWWQAPTASGQDPTR